DQGADLPVPPCGRGVPDQSGRPRAREACAGPLTGYAQSGTGTPVSRLRSAATATGWISSDSRGPDRTSDALPAAAAATDGHDAAVVAAAGITRRSRPPVDPTRLREPARGSFTTVDGDSPLAAWRTGPGGLNSESVQVTRSSRRGCGPVCAAKDPSSGLSRLAPARPQR